MPPFDQEEMKAHRFKKLSKVMQLTVGEGKPKPLIFLAPKTVHTFAQSQSFRIPFFLSALLLHVFLYIFPSIFNYSDCTSIQILYVTHSIG